MNEAGETASLQTETPRAAGVSRWSRFGWPVLVALASLGAIPGVFTWSRIFYVRDLSFVRWPEHLWFRAAIANGEFPMWDPYVGFGQSAIADPARHLLFPPVLLLRMLLPTVIGFNLCVALPFPIAALGMYALLRQRASTVASALGAIVFAMSGPVLSTGNFINMTWAVALIPWVVLAADRLANAPTRRRFAAFAVLCALQFLAGEAVTVVVTSALAVAYAAAVPDRATWARRARATFAVVGAGVTAILLAAAQAMPLASAISRSARSGPINPGMLGVWALHPLSMVELVTPALFGDPLASGEQSGLWLGALNSGREPFILSTYLGIAVVALAVGGALGGSEARLRRFWAAVFVLALVFALGQHTPVYATLQYLVPPLQALRYSSKYMVFVAFAAAVLAHYGWRSLFEDEPARRIRMTVAAVFIVSAASAAIVGIAALATPGAARAALGALAGGVGIESRDAAASFLVKSLTFGSPRLLVLSLGALGACWLGASARPDARLGRSVLFVMIAADLAVSGIDLNPTIDAARMSEPGWVALTRSHPADRIYIGGRLSSAYDYRSDPDDPVPEKGLEVTEDPTIAVSAMNSVFFATFPSAWRLRDSMSYDNNLMWPREYGSMVKAFRDASREQRIAYLRRCGVRYYLVPWRDAAGRTLEDFPDRAPLGLYEGADPVPRASIATRSVVEPDAVAALRGLLTDGAPDNAVVLESAGSPSGETGPSSATGTAAIEEDRAGRVRVRATVPGDGAYLVLRDTFTPDWTASVDGAPALIERADGLFRAVWLGPGQHVVTFGYAPRSFWMGLVVSAATAVILLGMCVAGRRRQAA